MRNTRASGSFSGTMTFTRKATSAIAIALTSFVLQASGFVEPAANADGIIPVIEQTPSAQWALRLVILIPINLLITIVYRYAGKLKLSQQTSRLIKRLLQKRQNDLPLTGGELAA